jgi:hypothetical protein
MKKTRQAKATARKAKPGIAPAGRTRTGYRRLSWDEVVSRGDYVADEDQPLEAWDGPTGFRAGSFVKPTYRKGRNKRRRPASTKKPERKAAPRGRNRPAPPRSSSKSG